MLQGAPSSINVNPRLLVGMVERALREQVQMQPTVKFKPLHDDAVVPSYAKPGDAGMDLYAYCGHGSWDGVKTRKGLRIAPGERKLVPCGIAIEIQDGYEGQVRPRSGNALKRGVTVLNSPGTIDSGYRGEVAVLLHNTSDEDQDFYHGDRIGQLVIAPVSRANIEVVEELSDSERGEGGFGSTGQ